MLEEPLVFIFLLFEQIWKVFFMGTGCQVRNTMVFCLGGIVFLSSDLRGLGWNVQAVLPVTGT